MYTPKDPTPATIGVIRDAAARYDLDDRADFADASRGLIATIPDDRVPGADGKLAFDLRPFSYVSEETPAPDSVDRSLWRQSQLITKAGLFKVTDQLYQVRNTNIGNLTIVEGADGVVIIDTTSSVEAARQGMGLFRRHVSDKPVAAVIYTHTHIDHYGGVKGVVDPADVASGKVPILAPGTISSFDKFAIGENVVAGNAMSRRALYAFGALLDHDPRQFVTCGIGIGGDGPGSTVSYLSPTEGITQTGTRRTLAGLTFEFLYAPDTEAPEEMHIWIPELKALTCAENANHSLHNIQTLRGARTRDARNFARYLDETLERWGAEAEVHYGPHTWPVWGNSQVTTFLESQRDTYKYIHDQALRLANKGVRAVDAAESLELPEQLARRWWNRGYHGTFHHDVRAVYTKELGMWDGDPVSLHPLPATESGQRWVDLIGADAILAEGRRAIDDADYRWAAEVLHPLVFAQPGNQAARELQADAYEQLGYQAEGPQWRGIYLTAARELREGAIAATFASASPDTILSMPIDILFDYAAVHVIGAKAAAADIRIGFLFSDSHEDWTMWVANGVLNARRGVVGDERLTLAGPKGGLVAAILEPVKASALLEAGRMTAEGDRTELIRYSALLDTFDRDFPMVTPVSSFEE